MSCKNTIALNPYFKKSGIKLFKPEEAGLDPHTNKICFETILVVLA